MSDDKNNRTVLAGVGVLVVTVLALMLCLPAMAVVIIAIVTMIGASLDTQFQDSAHSRDHAPLELRIEDQERRA